ncbi:MFS transporter [Streptomyces sp. WG-D5]
MTKPVREMHEPVSTVTATPPAYTPRRAWGYTGLLFFVNMVAWADKGALGLVAQPMSKELGLRASDIGLAGSLFFLTFTIGGLFTGTINRTLPLRWSLGAGVLIWSALSLPVVITASFSVLIIARLLMGMTEGPSIGLVHTAVYSWHPPEKRALPGAVAVSSATVSKILAVPMLAWVTVEYGWRMTLIVISAFGVCWFAVWMPVWRDGPFISSGREPVAAKLATGASTSTAPWRTILLSRTFLSVLVSAMSVQTLVSVVLTFLPSYFEIGLGYSRIEAGSLLVFPSAVGLLGIWAMSLLGDQLAARGRSIRTAQVVIPSVGVALSGVLLMTLPLTNSATLGLVVITFGYGCVTMSLPSLTAVVSQVATPHQTAGALGFYTALSTGLGGLIGPYATGRIVDSATNPRAGYATAFLIFGAIATVCALGAIIFADPARDKRRLMAHLS